MQPTLNLSAYRFLPLQDLPSLRDAILARSEQAGLKGTVLLASEGINLFVAGPPAACRAWLDWLCREAVPQLAGPEGFKAKESWSAGVPFRRMRVKIKREIIRMNMPAIVPADGRAPAVTPQTLARWLQQGHDDEGRPVVTLDTRNDFEVDAGAFEGAIDWRLGKFSDFPQALAEHLDELRDKTVVSYCTGGIRCEKAALVMQNLGLRHSYQLDGGILRYFEETQGAPGWRGQCFVFDERVALDAALREQAGPASG